MGNSDGLQFCQCMIFHFCFFVQNLCLKQHTVYVPWIINRYDMKQTNLLLPVGISLSGFSVATGDVS